MSEWISSVSRRPNLAAFLWAVGAFAAGTALAVWGGSRTVLIALAGSLAYAGFALVSVRKPLLFVVVFLFSLEILPPFFFSGLGDTPVYFPLVVLPVALLILLFRFPDIQFTFDPLALGLAAFLGGTVLSLPFAFSISGIHSALEGISRWLLLGLTAPVYFLVRGCSSYKQTSSERWLIRFLLAGAVLSAGFGILDFVWPMPFAHPAADQFIWLGTKVLRRAQGVFYESSNFANFCGFFLVLVAAAFLARKERCLATPRWLLIFLMPVFSLAVLVSFSRSTWAAVGVALLLFAWRSGYVKPRRAFVLSLAVGIPLLLVWKSSPDLWNYFLQARLGRLTEILADPNTATSGRFDTWLRVLSIISDNPLHLWFGVGYKTLPSTRLFHGQIITDNGYLNLLLETGLTGLGGFLIFSAAILKTFSRLARVRDDELAYWSNVMFSIWCGELVQLLAVDAYTFWRNILVMIAVMGLALNRAERLERSLPPNRAGASGVSLGETSL